MLLTILTNTALLALYVAGTFVVADIVKATYKHYSRGNEHHPMPFPLHFAFIVAVVEVCFDKPIAFHHSRMSAVDRAERRRDDRIASSMRRHPASGQAREFTMSSHSLTSAHDERTPGDAA